MQIFFKLNKKYVNNFFRLVVVVVDDENEYEKLR